MLPTAANGRSARPVLSVGFRPADPEPVDAIRPDRDDAEHEGYPCEPEERADDEPDQGAFRTPTRTSATVVVDRVRSLVLTLAEELSGCTFRR